VGEGITECMLNMWFVEEGARVEEWDKLCEMQSDKAAVEISVNYTGVIKKLYAQADDMVKTGAALVDIDDGLPEEEGKEHSEEPVAEITEKHQEEQTRLPARDEQEQVSAGEVTAEEEEEAQARATEPVGPGRNKEEPRKGPSLATPAVRGLLKEHKINISKVKASGKDGRVLKEDVQTFLQSRKLASARRSPALSATSVDSKQVETAYPLSPIQSQMYRAMTASLTIPHFLYADEVNATNITSLRRLLNHSRGHSDPKLTLLPFILKAVSISLSQYPLLNARIDTTTNSSKPQLIYRDNHDIGIAMDTPAGLLVPVVKNVAALSIAEIAHEIKRLSELGQAKKLSSADLSAGTITVSNIGNIGGTVVAPMIVEGQVAILGIGKSRSMPVFGEAGSIEKAEIMNFSWSADHRVVDGATMARMGSMVKKLIEEPEKMMVKMR
jgi:2-oxoisovalerate dehydrogenase E2 component (dihydrolipoyl transacylase)